MKPGILLLTLMVAAHTTLADGLPVITSHPQGGTRQPGVPISFSVASTNATGFQWRLNGADIPGETNSTLSLASPQAADAGYYMVVAKNAFGWVPSQLAYLAVVTSAGTVPFGNRFNPDAIVFNYCLLTSGTARVFAGPELDQMSPALEMFPAVGVATATVANGYYGHWDVSVPSVSPGQTVYYRVDVTYTNGSGVYTLPSRVLTLVAGGPSPSTHDLRFPCYIEWPAPFLWYSGNTPTNQVCVPGATVTFTRAYNAGYDFGPRQFQWRKDGVIIPGATNSLVDPPYGYIESPFLTITNARASDAGVYDVIIKGDYWFIDGKTSLSIQLPSTAGVLVSPRFQGAQFVCELIGPAGQNYALQWSSNLTSWNDLQILTNATGAVEFTDVVTSAGARYYRTVLLP
jgi:hypothetical protein